MAQMHNPAHPGDVLREFLPKKLPLGEVASRLGVSRQALSALLNGRAGVSAEMALSIAPSERRGFAGRASRGRGGSGG